MATDFTQLTDDERDTLAQEYIDEYLTRIESSPVAKHVDAVRDLSGGFHIFRQCNYRASNCFKRYRGLMQSYLEDFERKMQAIKYYEHGPQNAIGKKDDTPS